MAIDISARASAVGVSAENRSFEFGELFLLPQRIAVIAQGNSDASYSTERRRVTNAGEAGRLYGFGSPIHLIVNELLPNHGDGVGSIPVTVYPLEDAGSGVAATGAIAAVPSQTAPAAYRVVINEIASSQFVVHPGDTAADVSGKVIAAINGVISMPVKASLDGDDVKLTAKWAGETGNSIHVEVIGGDGGTAFTVTNMTGGIVNPSVDGALAMFGGTWETLVLNALGPDTDALTSLQTFGDGRWGATEHKPFVAFYGETAATVQNAITVPDARKLDRVNAQLVSPGSKHLPFVVAARQLARIASMANNNPPTDYTGLVASGLTPGSAEWDYTERDFALKSGSSTVAIRNDAVVLQDTVTFYHPDGDEDPAFRYVVDIVKLQNIIYNVNAIFEGKPWAGAALIPDNQVTTNPLARQPKAAKAELFSLTDNLAATAIISDPDYTKRNMQVGISSVNPKRLDISLPVRLSGNASIIDAVVFFSFFYGGGAAAA